MPLLALSLGSNINPRRNIQACLELLQTEFGPLQISQVYESEAVGFDGANFMNLAAVLNCDMPLANIQAQLKDIENQLGRDRKQPRFSGRTMDVDILLYGDSEGEECGLTLPRPEITENAFVLLPLSELLPDTIHKPSGKTYAALWQQYDKSKQKLWPIVFSLDD